MAGTEEETESVWWAAPKFVVSAVAVILLVIAGIILFVVVGNDEQSDAAPPAPTPTTSPSSSSTPTTSTTSEESVCGLDATGGTTLTAAPADVEWEFLGGIAAPKSTEHGPGVVDEQTGVRSCYSHTPEGALLAVTGMFAASGDTELLLDTTQALVIDGPGKQVTVSGLEERISSGNTTSIPIEVSGFRLLSYSESEATVEVVLAGDSGDGKVYQTTAANVVWQDGDWYFQVNDDGSGGPIDGLISDLSGYIPWGPTNG